MSAKERVKLKDWIFDANKNTLVRGCDEEIILEPTQSLLLDYLIKKHHQPVSRVELAQHVWKSNHVDERTINSAISKLRKTLTGDKKDYIKTVPQIGYSLICDISIVSQKVEKPLGDRPPEKNEQSRYYSPVNIFLFLLFITTIVGVFVSLSSPDRPPLPYQIPTTPITYLEGQELYPAMSPKQDYLAFVYAENAKFSYRVVVQDRKTQKTHQVEAKVFSTSPFWSADGQFLYYQTFENEQCLIKRVAHLGNLTFGEIQILTDCGNQRSMSPIAIDKTNHWLYFSYKNSSTSPFYLSRKNLINGRLEVLTAPKGNDYGDYSLSLSHDGNKIAFLRSIADTSKKLMLLDIESGDTNEMLALNHHVFSVTWDSISQKILFIDAKQALTAIDIKSKQQQQLYYFSENAYTPVLNEDSTVLVALGKFYKGDIVQKDLSDIGSVAIPVIHSSFNDHSAAINPVDNNTIAFISDRSGTEQIWLFEKGSLSKLTEVDSSKAAIHFSPDGLSLIYLSDHQLILMDLKNGKTKNISSSHEKIRNPIWLCNNNVVLASSYENDIWTLVGINLSTGDKDMLLPDVTSIKSDCETEQYYITKEHDYGVFKLADDLKSTVKNEVFLQKYHFIHDWEWDVQQDDVYFYGQEIIRKFNIIDEKYSSLNLNKHTMTRFYINKKKILLSVKSLNNNSIMEVVFSPNKSQ